MKKHLTFLLFSALLLSALPVLLTAQTPADENHAACGTDHWNETQLANDPAYRESRARMEQRYQEFLRNFSQSSANKTASGQPYFVIPMVVHVVYGDPSRSGADSIPAGQIMNAIPRLFEDYRNMPGTIGYNDVGQDYQVEFTLASIDPNGNPTNGIVYHYDPTLSTADDVEESQLKNTYTWPKNKYFNVWLVSVINKNVGGGTVLGYSSFPQDGDHTKDGVVIRSDCFGTGFNAGGPGASSYLNRTATHEFGHWLNLYHPFQPSAGFQDGCGGTTCTTAGDNVCDTPPVKAANYNTVSSSNRMNSCNNDLPDQPDNPRNYMDYLDDSQKAFFTHGQWVRSLSVLNDVNIPQRYDLWQDANLMATGTGPFKPAVSNFVANRQKAPVGSSIQFMDYSRNVPMSWMWDFGDGSTSTVQNPAHAYTQAGTYNVSLIVDNNTTSPDTLAKMGYITVYNDTAIALPYSQGFETVPNTVTWPKGWWVANPDSAYQVMKGMTWGMSGTIGGKGKSSHCARITLSQYTVLGAKDYLTTPGFDFSADTGYVFRYTVAYVPLITTPANGYTIMFSDTLALQYSTDGGATWTNLQRKGGKALSFGNTTSTTQWSSPKSTEWRTDSVSLDFLKGQANVRFRFVSQNGWGNDLFLDDIEIAQRAATTGVDDTRLEDGSVRVMPNPFSGTTNLGFRLTTSAEVKAEVFDMAGRSIYHVPAQRMNAGEQNLVLDLSAAPAGLYIVKLHADGQMTARRVVKQ